MQFADILGLAYEVIDMYKVSTTTTNKGRARKKLMGQIYIQFADILLFDWFWLMR